MPPGVAELMAPRKPKSPKARFELQAPASWMARASKVAETLGLSLAAYIRLVVSEDMDRREHQHKPKS